MSEGKKHNLVQGALILTVATVIVKIIGALFKVPLTNMIGGVGMGYFNSAYHLFNPLYALSTSGLPVAVSRMVSESVALGKHREARKIMRLSTTIFMTAGIAAFLIMILGSKLFVNSIKNANALWCVIALSPAVFFGCMTSSYRGYYEGLRNMYPTALSQIIEAVVKLAAGIGFTYMMLEIGMNQYIKTGVVFGKTVANMTEARAAALPYAAAGAVAGVTLSTLAGWAFLALRHKVVGDGIMRSDILSSPKTATNKELFKKIMKIAVPVCLGSLALNITSLVDLVSIMNRLSKVITNNLNTLLEMYKGNISEEALVDTKEIGNYLYGIFSTMPATFFNIIPAITTTLGISALTNMTKAWTERNRAEIKLNIETTLKITSLIAMPAGIGLMALSKPVLTLFFSSKPQEVNIATPMLQVMGVAVIFVSLVSPINSLLQAIGRADLPVKFMVCGAVVKLAMNHFLVAIPSFNIQAAPYGTLACYIIMSMLALYALIRNTKVQINAFSIFIKPLFSAGVCAVSARLCYIILRSRFGNTVSTVISVAVAAVIYLITLFMVKGIEKNDIKMLPKGEKIAKVLEKLKIMR